jgi:hypothetical protein
VSSRRPARARIDLTRLGAWILGIVTVAMLIFGLVTAISMWDTTEGKPGSRAFLVVWLVLWVGFGLNSLRICVRRTAVVRLRAGVRPGMQTPLFSIRSADDRPDVPSGIGVTTE